MIDFPQDGKIHADVTAEADEASLQGEAEMPSDDAAIALPVDATIPLPPEAVMALPSDAAIPLPPEALVAPSASEEGVSADAYRLLRTDIISGALKAGSRLRFVELQARYGIGTSPLREALSRLAAERLVLQEVNRGFRVPPISLADFADVAAVRMDIERKAIEAAVRNGDEAWEEGIVLAHHRLRRLGRVEAAPDEDGVPEEWELRHRAFHTALIAACGSPWTLHFCGVLHDQFDRYRRRAGRDPAAQVQLSRQHEELLEATVARDVERAGAILARHIDDTRAAVLERLRRQT